MIKKYERLREAVIVSKRRDECYTNKHLHSVLGNLFFFLSQCPEQSETK